MRDILLSGTTSAGGAVTVNAESAVFGLLYAIQLIDGTFDDGVDITLTCENANMSIPLLVQANFNSDQMVYPRVVQALNTDGTALLTHTLPVLAGVPKMVIAQGGSAKTGGCILYVLVDYQ